MNSAAITLRGWRRSWAGNGWKKPPEEWPYAFISTSISHRLSLRAFAAGVLYDFNIDYRLRPDVTLTGYAGHAQGLAAIRAIYPKGTGSNFGYLELQYRF